MPKLISPTVIFKPSEMREYSWNHATFAQGMTLTHLDEGISTGFAFPVHVVDALIKQEDTGVEKPSDALGKGWFTKILLNSSVAGNGFWGGGSSSLNVTPGMSDLLSSRIQGLQENGEPFSEPFRVGADGVPVLRDELLIDGVRGSLRDYNKYRDSSGCPGRHTTFSPVDGNSFGYIGGNQVIYDSTRDSDITRVEMSAIELAADALDQSYRYVTGTQVSRFDS